MYKAKNNILPTITELFTPKIQTYSLRNNDTYVLPRYHTKTYGYRSMTYIGSKLWGNIDAHIKSQPNIKAFKKEIKLWIINVSNVIDTYF